MALSDVERQRAAAVIVERTRHYVPSFLADEAIEELEAAGWTITPPPEETSSDDA